MTLGPAARYARTVTLAAAASAPSTCLERTQLRASVHLYCTVCPYQIQKYTM